MVLACIFAMADADGGTIALARRLAIQFGVIFVYLAPSMISQRYQHPKHTAILVVNLALGWTIVGWVIALIWALKGRPQN
jgi:hypothetical protein